MSAFPAKEFAKVVFPADELGVGLMLRAYFDDSGTHAGSAFAVWGGVIGPNDLFDEFEREWQTLLNEPLPGKPKLKKFSLYDCAIGEGEFATYRPAERDSVRFLAREIIAKSKLKSVAFGIPLNLWRSMLPANVRRAYGLPHGIAFASCANLALGLAEQSKRPLACVFDKGQQKPALEQHIRLCDKKAEELGVAISYSFGAVKDHLGLQAADVVATQHYWRGKEVFRGTQVPKDPHHLSMLKYMVPAGLMMDPDSIIAIRQHFERLCPAGEWPSDKQWHIPVDEIIWKDSPMRAYYRTETINLDGSRQLIERYSDDPNA